MTRYLLGIATGILATVLLAEPEHLAMSTGETPDCRITLQTASGERHTLTAEQSDDEDYWFDMAHRIADAKREAIAVTQNGRLVMLANPKR